jgi:branched-chain amino acid transport system substrate-binding protein
MKKLLLGAALAAAVAGASIAAFATSGSASPGSQTVGAHTLITCGKTRIIGLAFPATGDAAALGQQQLRWALFAQQRWNRTHKNKIGLIQGDTQLPNTAQALAVSHQFASNPNMLALVGPAGSQEVQDTITVYKNAGFGAITGSATRVALTRSKPGKPRETPLNYFFRTVPNDDQQGSRVTTFIRQKLKKTRIYIIDDEEAYSQGLADRVQTLLRARRATVTRDHVSQSVSDFSSLITRIPSNTQVVYIPWQLAGKAQLFFTQLRTAGKNAIVFGSDGLFAPGTFTAPNSYVSSFPVDFNSAVLKAYKRTHAGKEEAFGLPSYTATWINAMAIDKACKNGTATRAEVRQNVLKAKLSAKKSLLGFPVRFLKKNFGDSQGPGDMANPANFAVFHIIRGGKYVRVA